MSRARPLELVAHRGPGVHSVLSCHLWIMHAEVEFSGSSNIMSDSWGKTKQRDKSVLLPSFPLLYLNTKQDTVTFCEYWQINRVYLTLYSKG